MHSDSLQRIVKRSPAKRPSVNTFADRFARRVLSAFPSVLYDGHITQRVTMVILVRYFLIGQRLLVGLIQ